MSNRYGRDRGGRESFSGLFFMDKMASKTVSMTRVQTGRPLAQKEDHIAVEEPLEIRIAGDPVAVTMRTPGDDDRLAVGFLFGEGILSSIEDVGKAVHCGRSGTPEFGNAIDVLPAPGVSFDLERVQGSRRGSLTTAACGVCGRQSIDDLLERCRPITWQGRLSIAEVMGMVGSLRTIQPTFERTGGVHAAAVFSENGSLLASYEDIGRHNAVDKVVGALLFDGLIGLRKAAVLAVSGRSSFEIVQKATVARIPVVASVSAASSLAVDLAEEMGITLAGFVRKGRLNLYTGQERVV